MTAIADTAPGPIVRWHYLGYSACARRDDSRRRAPPQSAPQPAE